MANNKAKQMFGYDCEIIIDKNIEMLIPRYGPLNQLWNAGFCEYKVQSFFLEQVLHLNAIHNNGKEFPVEVEINPLITEKGIMFLSSIINITERDSKLKTSFVKFYHTDHT